jgi:hypothetical protein
LEVSLATAERTYQGLAWEANARVANAGGEYVRAEECIAKGLSAVAGYEVPLAAWRLRDKESAEHHRELSRGTITKLADSPGPEEEALRTTFLSASSVERILGYVGRADG